MQQKEPICLKSKYLIFAHFKKKFKMQQNVRFLLAIKQSKSLKGSKIGEAKVANYFQLTVYKSKYPRRF